MEYAFEKIADGISGVEGPVFDIDGRLFVVEPPKGRILQIFEDGRTREHAHTDGIPAGLAVDVRNSLWVADMKLGILRVNSDGEVQPIVSEFAGAAIRGCNDLAVDAGGNLYFTAPAGSNETVRVGQLFCRLADGQVTRLDDGFAFCNGIAIAPDGKLLIVAETFTKKLWAYDLLEPGRVSSKRTWTTLSGTHSGGPDGIDFDVKGNLLAANWGGAAIEVFDSNGVKIEQISTPFKYPSNLHFGGPDGCDLWITEHSKNAVWRTRWQHPGLLAMAMR